MAHSFYLRMILLTSVAILLSNCCSKKVINSNSGQNTANAKSVSTGSSECDRGVQKFNKEATRFIISDISTVYSGKGYIPEDLKQLYPAARIAWNRALNQVGSNYTSSYTVTSLDPLATGVIIEWRSKNLQDYQKFFLLLAEYRYGAYPDQTRDGLTVGWWIEKADAKKRIEAYVKFMITAYCHSIDSESIKKLINPELLPESIEACYQ